VVVQTDGMQTIGKTPPRRFVRYTCAYRLAIGPTQILSATGLWKAERPSSWKGELLTFSSSQAKQAESNFHASVRSDGTIRMP
jgi:hypothetical protein